MNVLHTMVTTPFAQAVGWTILHSLWEGFVVAACLGVVIAVTKSARVRYAAACIAMLAMLFLSGLTFVRMNKGGHGIPPVKSAAAMSAAVRADAVAPAVKMEASAYVPWLMPLWIAGVWAFALWQFGGWISLSRLRRRGVCCAAESWQCEIRRIAAQLRIARPVVLLESALAEVPMVIGHLRPVVLMPVGLMTGLSAEQIEAILLHELAHIARHDYLLNLAQRCIECLFFYHPAIWWITGVIRAERENCCDDIVVQFRGNADVYAAALATLERNRWSGRDPAMAATGGSLVKRIRRLIEPKTSIDFWTPALAAVIVILTVAACFAARPAQAKSSPIGQNSQQASAYDKWLHEDVVYIISKEEQSEFEKLKTDDERNKFIEQFWERRNPSPGSPLNEFKQEHYRRIAYANRHFAAGVPGWKTDRGRTYIVYGRPYEIDAHVAAKPPYEEWKYSNQNGQANMVFKFVDFAGNGDYRLSKDDEK